MENILAYYFSDPDNYTLDPIGDGHINDTYRLRNPEGKDYLLQRINHQVFPDVPVLMNNFVAVTGFLKSKAVTDSQQANCLTVFPALDGQFYKKDDRGNYWRILNFFEQLIAHNVPDPNAIVARQQIYSAAQAFGNFLYQLGDFPADDLIPVLPDFHNVPVRLSQLEAAIRSNPLERVSAITRELEIIEQLRPQMCRIQALADAGKIPLRVTHNDTKFNNVMFDKNGIAKAVIDLDTVMPGYVHYDYGDGLRTATVTTAEDEANPDLIQVDRERYTAFHEGYLSATSDLLQPTEKETLPLAAPTLAYIMAVRFFTDYLSGDVYYKITYPEQNLRRGKAQLKLTEQFLLLV